MTKLDRLISELCPDGVEFVSLGKIATDMYRGAGIKRDEITRDGIPCVRYGEIYTTYNIWFNTCVSHTKTGTKTFEHGDILFAITGESVDEIAKSCAYMGHDMCYAGGDIVVMKHNQNPKYIAYALSTTGSQIQKSKGKVKSKVVHSNIPALREITIPLPPLPVQCEIVRILDNFTELTAELTARRKQYEYYRNELLTFGDDVPMVTLGKIAKIGTGSSNTNEELEQGAYPFFVRSQEVRYKNTYEFDETAIITSGDGVGVGKIFHFIQGKYALHQRAYRIRVIDNQVNPKYLFHYMKSNFLSYMQMTAVHASVTSVRKPMLDKYHVPAPSLAEQAHIIAILDKFDTLTANITSGLPAEIVARQKQYEYYRDKLLRFS